MLLSRSNSITLWAVLRRNKEKPSLGSCLEHSFTRLTKMSMEIKWGEQSFSFIELIQVENDMLFSCTTFSLKNYRGWIQSPQRTCVSNNNQQTAVQEEVTVGFYLLTGIENTFLKGRDLLLFITAFLAHREGPGHCRHRTDNCGRNVCNSSLELNRSRKGKDGEDTRGSPSFFTRRAHPLLSKYSTLLKNISLKWHQIIRLAKVPIVPFNLICPTQIYQFL